MTEYSSLVDIATDHPAFAGHFPGQPILPGVLLLERVMTVAQTCLILPFKDCALHNVKFIAAVGPGDRLRVDLTLSGLGQYNFHVRIMKGGGAPEVLACSGQLRLAQVCGLQA